jgi:hypothetical protein
MPSKKEKEDETKVTNSDSEEDEETSNNDEGNEDDDQDDQRIPVDLSENEIYRGVCTLLEDDDGNNILEYISLLHTELIGINKSLENLRLIRKDITRLADCAEIFLKGKKEKQEKQEKHEKQEVTEVTTTGHKKKVLK